MSDLAYALGKTPPHNLEAEQAALGSILLDSSALNKALEIAVKPDDFYQWSHRMLFSAMLDLDEKNEPIDLITLTNHVRNKGILDKIGGASYISSLVDRVNSSANIRYYSKIIREKSLLRSLIESSNEIMTQVYETDMAPEDLVDFAEQKIFDISEKRINVSFEKMDSLLKDTFKTIENLYSQKMQITGVPSGFNDLDQQTTGFQNGELIIIWGRPLFV